MPGGSWAVHGVHGGGLAPQQQAVGRGAQRPVLQLRRTPCRPAASTAAPSTSTATCPTCARSALVVPHFPVLVLLQVGLEQEDFEDAARHAKRAAELDRAKWSDLAQRTEAALRQSKTKDYYKILGE